MKKKLFFIVALLLLNLNFTSCKKKDKKEELPTYYIKAKFDGSEKIFKNPFDLSQQDPSVLNFRATKGISDIIEVYFSKNLTTGNFQLNRISFNKGTKIYTSNDITGNSQTSITGTIQINSSTYEGTFSGTLVNLDDDNDKVVITEGEFKIEKK